MTLLKMWWNIIYEVLTDYFSLTLSHLLTLPLLRCLREGVLQKKADFKRASSLLLSFKTQGLRRPEQTQGSFKKKRKKEKRNKNKNLASGLEGGRRGESRGRNKILEAWGPWEKSICTSSPHPSGWIETCRGLQKFGIGLGEPRTEGRSCRWQDPGEQAP